MDISENNKIKICLLLLVGVHENVRKQKEGESEKVKTRYMGYEDYGISMEEAYRAIKFCRDPKQRNTNLCIVMMSAFESNRYIWKELMTSACYNLSYQKMTKKKPINYEEVDFYAYRRKMIAILAKKLRTAKGA